MSKAPETIWALEFDDPVGANHLGIWGTVNGLEKVQRTKYHRADLPATDKQAFANERVKALVEASDALLCDPTLGLDHEQYMKLRAALKAIASPSTAGMEPDNE